VAYTYTVRGCGIIARQDSQTFHHCRDRIMASGVIMATSPSQIFTSWHSECPTSCTQLLVQWLDTACLRRQAKRGVFCNQHHVRAPKQCMSGHAAYRGADDVRSLFFVVMKITNARATLPPTRHLCTPQDSCDMITRPLPTIACHVIHAVLNSCVRHIKHAAQELPPPCASMIHVS
jgi:hypothetical protein